MSRAFSTAAALLVLVATSHVVAQQQGQTARGVAVPTVTGAGLARVVPAKGSPLTTILGNALDSTNGQLANVTVRLRDARFGRIVDTQYTDKSGMFAFKTLEPGSYIVEIIANDQSILAASQLLNVQGGAVTTIVKLPFRIPPFANMMGTATTQAAVGVALEAAATGITALVPTAPISPNQ
jgi:SdrD B-like domain